MFQFAGFPSAHYGFMYGYMESFHVGSPIQISPVLRIFAPPRGFSQLITSFFGSQCQGIRPAPFPLDRPFRAFPRHSVAASGPRTVSRVSWYSGYRCADSVFAYGAFTLSGWSSQGHSAGLVSHFCGPYPAALAPRFGLFPFRSPLLRKSIFLSLPPAT